MGKKSKKRIRFGSRSEKETLDFVDPNKDPRRYIRRYLLEQNYKDWFDRNYPNYTIYEAVGLAESDYDEIKRDLFSEQEQTPSIEKSQPKEAQQTGQTNSKEIDQNNSQESVCFTSTTLFIFYDFLTFSQNQKSTKSKE